MSAARSTFQASEFATMAGVTVRALHHYDRIGLLKPQRSSAGYRIYTARDLALLEQIVVLKFVGIPLRQIAALMRADPKRLADSLRAQRGTLERKRQLLDQAIAAIGDLEATVATGQPAAPHLFKRIIEVIEMQNNPDAWTQQYKELVSARIERLRSLSPEALAEMRAQWRVLVAEIRTALAEDPASAKAQAFGDRWRSLLAQLMGQPVDATALRAHHGAQEWSPSMASFVEKPVWDFMTRVLAARR